jgi:predicted ester cyclase
MTTQQSELEQNKAIIRRFIEEVQNKKKFAVYDELVDATFTNLSSPPGVPADRDGTRQYLQGFLNAFPDSQFTVDDMIAERDRIVTKKTLSGTHGGNLGEIQATGKPVKLQYVDIMRVRHGKIVEHWVSMDRLSLLQQLGALPPG